jgi:riboflavin kinase/FMN adenylyltransferase
MDAVPDLPPPIIHGRDQSRPFRLQPSAVAVGNFDGVHLGHAALAGRLRAVAERAGVPAVALTFDPHPASIVRPEAAPVPLTTPARRAELLLAAGLDAVLVQPTDRHLLGLSAAAFYRDVLRGWLQAVALVEGPDFRFGSGRDGDVRLLAEFCQADAIPFEVVPPVEVGGTAVSSSRIRGLVAAGDVAAAATLLTAPYRLEGTVVTGARRGRALGFPTANLADVATLVPGLGVYAAVAGVAGAAGRHATGGRTRYAAAVHVGPNATFGEALVTVEAHLIGFTGDLYGCRLEIDFLEKLRDTRTFASVEELQRQLAIDVTEAAVRADVAGGRVRAVAGGPGGRTTPPIAESQ